MEERKRTLVLSRSERSVWRLKSRFVAADLEPAALAHGNTGRVAAHRLDPALRSRVVALARDGYAGVNDTQLSELLAEREGIRLARSSGSLARTEGFCPMTSLSSPPRSG